MGDFIHFGCWNNSTNKKACFRDTFQLLKQYLNAHEVDMISVSGDNFYPSKIKDKTFENGKIVEKEGKKVALIHETPLAEGFRRLNELRSNIGEPGIKMILGNHDLQTGNKLIVSKQFEYDLERDDFEKEHGCNIIQWQLRNQGYEIQCHGLDMFPTNSVQLRKLIYKA